MVRSWPAFSPAPAAENTVHGGFQVREVGVRTGPVPETSLPRLPCVVQTRGAIGQSQAMVPWTRSSQTLLDPLHAHNPLHLLISHIP